MDPLFFDNTKFEIKTLELDGKSLTYREFGERFYCISPKASIQKMNIYVPEAYYEGKEINGYSLHTAPIFLPNGVGGYMEGGIQKPGLNRHDKPNSVFEALMHGYVVAAPGIRGRNTGGSKAEFFEGSDNSEKGTDDKKVGRAPALIVDYKAAIRYLRHNKDQIAGDVEKIITNGTSAGGALSALAGATGNDKEYEPYLKEIGAANERDDVFAASCYCPIINLEHADMAYEWQFNGINDYKHMRFKNEKGQVVPYLEAGTQTDEQQRYSNELKAMFPAYVNSLNLKDENGNPLSLEEQGNGSFKDYVLGKVKASLESELAAPKAKSKYAGLAVPESDAAQADYAVIENGKVKALDFQAYATKQTRMKTAPAFDHVDLSSAENEEFGNELIDRRHFTDYGMKNSTVEGSTRAEEELVHLINPMDFIKNGDVTKHWRIRHGSFDRDTSLAIPAMFALALENEGKDVDFALPWGLPHSGDYDLDDLFSWIDSLAK
jgi:hypothetical protein